MQTVKVKVQDLLKKVKENKADHREVYDKAVKEYQKKVVAHLQKLLTEAKKGKAVNLHVPLVQPVHYLDDYDRAVKMLEWTTQEEIELDQHEFAQYVMDEWQWQNHFAASNSAYVSMVGGKMAGTKKR